MNHRTLIVLGCLAAGGSQATTVSYSETVSGDLKYLYPGDTATVLNLDAGQNTVSGRLSSQYDFDAFAFSVPQATQLTGISLSFSQSTAAGYFPSNQGAGYGLSPGIGLPYAPYPSGNYAQTVYFSPNAGPTILFPLATPLSAGTYTVGDYFHYDFSSGYVDYTYTLNVQSLVPPPPPVPVDPGLAFLQSFTTAQSTVTYFQPGANLSQEEVLRNRDLVLDVQARRAAIELEYQQTTRAIWTDFWVDVGDISIASLEALGCVATAGIPCAAYVGADYIADEFLTWTTQQLLCERGDVECEVSVNLAYFTVNPTFESFNFDVSYLIRPDRDYIFDELNVGDTIGLKIPLFGNTDALTLVTLAGMEGSSVTLHFDGVRQVVNSVPEPSTLALLGLGLAGLGFSRRRMR